MAKIGIITFNFTLDNYGQVLQYLATQEYLKKLGHQAILVESNGWRRTFSRYIKWSFELIWNFIKIKILHPLFITKKKQKIAIEQKEKEKHFIFEHWASISKKQEKGHPRYFNEFRNRFFSIISGTYEDILEKNFDAFCVGSDQTWAVADNHWLLAWVPQEAKRFSIAPSTGHRKFTESEIKAFIPHLKKFNFITVREENGIQFCKQCGRYDAIKILDPVFLPQANSYNAFMDNTPTKEEAYVFIYMLGGEIGLSMNEIFSFCKQHGLKIKYVESQGRDEKFDNKIYATVGEWLRLIKGASLVITNSFHGTAFSIIFQKQFLTFPLINLMEDMNQRIYDLVEQMKLKERIYNGDMNVLLKKIDWSTSEEKISENRITLKQLIEKTL